MTGDWSGMTRTERQAARAASVVAALTKAGERRARRERLADAFAEGIGATIVNFFNAWMFMLAVGIAHHEWIPALPTIGYWWAFVLLGLLRIAFQPLKRSTPK